MRRGARVAALAAVLALAGCGEHEPATPTSRAPAAGDAPSAVGDVSDAARAPFAGDSPSAAASPPAVGDGDVSDPPLAPRAGPDDGWTEPLRTTHDGTDTWTWAGPRSTWELVLRGTPALNDDLTTLQWVAERDGFTLTFGDDGGESVIRATSSADGRLPGLDGRLAGIEAGPEQLQSELARWLPAVAAHLGLAADHRVEVALESDGLRGALREISTLTSSAARLLGYAALVRELDEPSNKQLAKLLTQAARDLPVDGDMRELLIEQLDLSLESRALADAVLAAAASIEDQDALGEVLSNLLTQTDEIPAPVLVALLEFAVEHLARDAPMATLLDEVSWYDLRTPQARAAWRAALATVEADGPHAQVVGELLSIGDAPPAECALVVRSAVTHIETESLRAQALAQVHLEQLADAGLADAYLEALASFEDVNVLTDLLTRLLKRPDGSVQLTLLWLHAARRLTPDGRLASLLGAVPTGQLSDQDVQSAYRQLAMSLWSESARSEALRRLPADPAH